MPKKETKKTKTVERENAIDAILDPANGNNVILLDGNGEEHEFEQVAIVPLLDVVYVILKPVNDPIVKENEAVVFAIDVDEDELEYYLDIVEDEDVIDAVFDNYTKMYEEELAKQKAKEQRSTAKTSTTTKGKKTAEKLETALKTAAKTTKTTKTTKKEKD